MLDPEALRAFVDRPWREVEAAKREHLAARYREDPDAHVDAVWALWEHLREERPEGPTTEEREADLEGHVAMRRVFERAAPALRSRAR